MSSAPEVRLGTGPGVPGAIDYRLMRRSVLNAFRRGRLGRHDVCDAERELLRAASNYGEPMAEDCPICEEAELVLVSFVFGPRLPAHGRCVTSKRELAELSERSGVACYVVEVCTACAWNHLARTYLLGSAAGT